MSSKKTIKVTQIASGHGHQKDQKATLTGLGLGKIHRTRELQDTPAIWGMINKVAHLVRVENTK